MMKGIRAPCCRTPYRAWPAQGRLAQSSIRSPDKLNRKEAAQAIVQIVCFMLAPLAGLIQCVMSEHDGMRRQIDCTCESYHKRSAALRFITLQAHVYAARALAGALSRL
jgi:hypothetical protein